MTEPEITSSHIKQAAPLGWRNGAPEHSITLYLRLASCTGSAMEWNCACRRILHTSAGVTTSTASVTPEPRPATNVPVLDTCPAGNGERGWGDQTAVG